MEKNAQFPLKPAVRIASKLPVSAHPVSRSFAAMIVTLMATACDTVVYTGEPLPPPPKTSVRDPSLTSLSLAAYDPASADAIVPARDLWSENSSRDASVSFYPAESESSAEPRPLESKSTPFRADVFSKIISSFSWSQEFFDLSDEILKISKADQDSFEWSRAMNFDGRDIKVRFNLKKSEAFLQFVFEIPDGDAIYQIYFQRLRGENVMNVHKVSVRSEESPDFEDLLRAETVACRPESPATPVVVCDIDKAGKPDCAPWPPNRYMEYCWLNVEKALRTSGLAAPRLVEVSVTSDGHIFEVPMDSVEADDFGRVLKPMFGELFD